MAQDQQIDNLITEDMMEAGTTVYREWEMCQGHIDPVWNSTPTDAIRQLLCALYLDMSNSRDDV